MNKTLNNTNVTEAKKQVRDLKVWGDGDTFQLICKASSEREGWMKSTKAMEIPGVGVVVQVSTQQEGYDESWAVAEALTFVPGARIMHVFDSSESARCVARKIVLDDEFGQPKGDTDV